MARNGTGTFNLVTNSWQPAINGVSATAADWQALINDVANALTQSASADGQTPITGIWNFGANRISNVGAGTSAGDALTYGQTGAVLSGLTVTNLTVTLLTGDTVTQPPGTSNTTIASTAFAMNMDSPAFTGVPTAPTASTGTNTTQIATTAFVAATALAASLPGQSGNQRLEITTDGTTASWGFSAGSCLAIINFFGL